MKVDLPQKCPECGEAIDPENLKVEMTDVVRRRAYFIEGCDILYVSTSNDVDYETSWPDSLHCPECGAKLADMEKGEWEFDY